MKVGEFIESVIVQGLLIKLTDLLAAHFTHLVVISSCKEILALWLQ